MQPTEKTPERYRERTEAYSDLRNALEGWTIAEVEITVGVEGGLTFHLERGVQERLVILGYTELGEWLEYLEDRDDACPA